MANLMYELSVPVMLKTLTNLISILDQAAQYGVNKKIDPSVLLNARLYPDMFALARQIQTTTDQAKGGAARLAGLPVPKYEDTETNIDELKARVRKTIDFLKSIQPEHMQSAEHRLSKRPLPALASAIRPLNVDIGYALQVLANERLSQGELGKAVGHPSRCHQFRAAATSMHPPSRGRRGVRRHCPSAQR